MRSPQSWRFQPASSSRSPGCGAASRRSCETTHEQIARELGTAREVVSRLLKVLERRGAVRLARGRVDIVDKARLDLAGDPRPLS